MNGRTAKLIRDAATGLRVGSVPAKARGIKRTWKRTPRKQRHKARRWMRRLVTPRRVRRLLAWLRASLGHTK